MQPGILLGSTVVSTSIAGARAWRVHYASQDYQGNPTESTGLVIAPEDDGQDRPLLTWCHGTTGLGDAACPSIQVDPARELAIYFSSESTASIDYGIPGLQSFVDAGWIVCATDYQGLGTPGMHHYMVNRTNALDALNIAHVVRGMSIGAGRRLGCMGWSQGGGAAAALAELDAEYRRELALVGTVAMSPGLIPLADPASLGPALAAPTGPPDAHLVMLIAGAAAANPQLKLSDMLTPLGQSIVEGAWNTQAVHHLQDTLGRLFRLKGPIIEVKASAVGSWKEAIAAGSALHRRPGCPVHVAMDTFDGGIVVPVAWQQAYVSAVAALGGTVTSQEYPNDDHFSLPASCVSDAQAWLTPLFAAT